MDKKRILSEIREDMNELFSNLDIIFNYDSNTLHKELLNIEHKIKTNLDFIYALHNKDLSSRIYSHITNEDINGESDAKIHEIETTLETTIETIKDTTKDRPRDTKSTADDINYLDYPAGTVIGPLIHHVYNGSIKREDGVVAFVPELRIQELGYSHGDIIAAIPNGKMPDGQSTKYKYSLVEARYEAEREDITRVYGLVEYEASRYIIKRDASGEFIRKTDGIPVTLLIQKGDVEYFDLVTDDVVLVAFYNDNPDSVRVRKKLDSSELQQFKKPGKKSDYVAEAEASEVKEDNVDENQFRFDFDLRQSRILVVGNPFNLEALRKTISENNGILFQVSGTATKKAIENAVKKSDYIVLVNNSNSHNAFNLAKIAAKKTKIPFIEMKGFGQQKLLMLVKELMEREEAEE